MCTYVCMKALLYLSLERCLFYLILSQMFRIFAGLRVISISDKPSHKMRHHCLCMTISVATFIAMNLVGAEEQKRAPSGFTGVRGKKSIPDSAYSEVSEAPDNSRESGAALEKRGPSGFFGMRGKKPFEGWISSAQQDYLEDVYKRATLGFTGMRGKKMDFGNYYSLECTIRWWCGAFINDQTPRDHNSFHAR